MRLNVPVAAEVICLRWDMPIISPNFLVIIFGLLLYNRSHFIKIILIDYLIFAVDIVPLELSFPFGNFRSVWNKDSFY